MPKWDKYNNNNKLYLFNQSTNSIFIFFTWRNINKNKRISILYYKNIITLLRSKLLIKSLKKFNVSLYYAFHHKMDFSMGFLNLLSALKYLNDLNNKIILKFGNILYSYIILLKYSYNY